MTSHASQTEATRVIAQLFLQRLTTGQHASLLDMFHDDGTWHLLGHTDVLPLARVYRKNEIPGMLQGIGSIVTHPTGLTIEETLADGHHAVIGIHPTGYTASGEQYDNRVLFLLEVHEEKIMAIREYLDTQHLAHVSKT